MLTMFDHGGGDGKRFAVSLGPAWQDRSAIRRRP